MKLFQRIFATFCMVIVCAISVASFSFWLVQSRLAENHSKQIHHMELNLLANALGTFQANGEEMTRQLLERWKHYPAAQNIIIIMGDNKKDILGRKIDPQEIEQAYELAVKNPYSNIATLYYDQFGEEYLFFIRQRKNHHPDKLLSPLLIPGLSLAPVWHEFIILTSTLIIGLLLAYIVAKNISKPIHILETGMNRLASGKLNTRVSHELADRRDELANLGAQFDKMAEQLQKLVEKERHLLHHVSHEMRSPLARIQALLGLIQAQPQKQDQYLMRLESELTRMDKLVEELLTLSRLETANMPMEKEAIPICALVRQIAEDSQAVAEKNQQHIELKIENLESHAKLLANERYLYRALDNVIRNAMNYSPAGSSIQIRMHEDKKNLHIEITDNGVGVKPEQLPHIFTAFYRADSSNGKSGTGLGLALTKHITEQHCGTIVAENIEPNGLKIHFILPKTTTK